VSDDIKFEAIDPSGDLEILMEGIDEIPADPATTQDPEFQTLTRDQIIEKVRSEREALAKTKSDLTQNAALTEVLKELKNRPQGPQMQVPQGPPPETEEQFKAKFNEKFYDSPYDTMMEFQQKKLGPEVQRIMFQNMQLSRKLAALDPERKDTFAMYGAEIDDIVAKMSPQEKLYDPDVFVKAHDVVISRHVNEIVDRKVREAVSGKTAPTGPQPAPFTERGTAPGPRMSPGAKQTVVLSRSEQAWASSQGLSKEAAGSFFVRHPEKRMK